MQLTLQKCMSRCVINTHAMELMLPHTMIHCTLIHLCCCLCFVYLLCCSFASQYSNARNRGTLAIAKSNINKHYSVVGLQEDLGSFFTVLETISPRMFKGAAAIYSSTSEYMSMFVTSETTRKFAPFRNERSTFKKKFISDYLAYISDATMYAKLKTSNKIPPSPKTVETVKILAALDYELYYFVKQRIQQQMSALLLNDHL